LRTDLTAALSATARPDRRWLYGASTDAVPVPAMALAARAPAGRAFAAPAGRQIPAALSAISQCVAPPARRHDSSGTARRYAGLCPGGLRQNLPLPGLPAGWIPAHGGRSDKPPDPSAAPPAGVAPAASPPAVVLQWRSVQCLHRPATKHPRQNPADRRLRQRQYRGAARGCCAAERPGPAAAIAASIPAGRSLPSRRGPPG